MAEMKNEFLRTKMEDKYGDNKTIDKISSWFDKIR